MKNSISAKFNSIDYLRSGNPRQQQVYYLLTQNRIFETLHPFRPVIAGTLPLAIDTPTSDIDIICSFNDVTDFETTLINSFSGKAGFSLSRKRINDQQSVVGSLVLEGLSFEVFGQAKPTEEQDAFRHMMVEHEILTLLGTGFREQIIKLKERGQKTEPAFASLLEIPGNPYQELLKPEVVRAAVSGYQARNSS